MNKNRKRKKPTHLARIPIAVEGGIRSQGVLLSTQSAWWSKQWLAVLERSQMGARFGRGRSYALSGQIRSLSIHCGYAEAIIQGMQQEPYCVRITPTPLSSSDAQAIGKRLDQEPIYRSRLLVHDLPFQIEHLFQEYKVSLFPYDLSDLSVNCNCPDWSRPCKHIAAVCIVLAEIFATNPIQFLIFRGLPKALFPKTVTSYTALITPTEQKANHLNQPYSQADFWGMPTQEPQLPIQVSETIGITLIHRLGPLPYWRGNEPFLPAMTMAYQRARDKSLEFLRTGYVDLRSATDRPEVKGANLKLKRYKLGFDVSL